MTELVASETTVVIALSAASALAIALTTLIVGVMFFAVFDGEETVHDVQRFVELTEEARSLLPGRPLLHDPDGETSAAIGRFLAKKEEARRVLWESRRTRLQEQAAADGGLQRHSERARFPQRPKDASEAASRPAAGVQTRSRPISGRLT
jgi:hypothetical protein